MVQKTEKMMKVFITNGQREPITGQCLYFIKPRKDQLLSAKNVCEVSVLLFIFFLNHVTLKLGKGYQTLKFMVIWYQTLKFYGDLPDYPGPLSFFVFISPVTWLPYLSFVH